MDTCDKEMAYKPSYSEEFQPNNQDLIELSSMPLDKHMQTRLWQQNQYLTDSGIQSGNSTHTPSVSSKLGVPEIEYDENTPNPKQQQPVQNRRWCQNFEPITVNPSDSNILSPAPMSTNSNSICQDSTDINGLQIASNTDLKGNKLPEIDTDEATNAIPDLVKLIKDEDDHVVLYQAAMMVFQLSKSESIESLIDSDEMIYVIISALNRTEDLETVRFLTGTLYNISQTQKGLKAIFAANCVPCLVKLLNSPIESVLFYAITTLHNLLLHQDGAKAVVRQSDCLQKMTSLLRKNNMKFLTICTDCLQILAYGHQESKLAILNSGGPAELVRILRTYTYEKLLWTTARVLKVLSVCTSNKPAIIQAGGMEALGRHLHHSSQRLAMNCLWTLRNMSDAATKVNNLQPLLQSLVQLLGSPDSNIVTCAAGIISNLTCNNYANKFFVFRFGGVKSLFLALSSSTAREEVVEPCMCALRHLTSRHEDEECARLSVVRELCGLPLLARVLHAATAGLCPELHLQPPQPQQTSPQQPQPLHSWTLVKAMVGLLRNLSINLDNHAPMREHGLVTGLILLLYGTIYTIQKQRSPNCTMVQNVRLEEIVEGICGALHMLMRDPQNRAHLAAFRGPPLVWPHSSHGPPAPLLQAASPGPALSLFLHLLHAPLDAIQRASAGVLVEASQHPLALHCIASLPGASARLEELVYSHNEAISTYCSAVIIRLQEEKGGHLGCSSMPPLAPPPMAQQQPQNSAAAVAAMETGLNTPPHHHHHHHHQHPQQQPNGGNPPPVMGYDVVEASEEELLYNSPPPTGSLSAMLGPPPGPVPQPPVVSNNSAQPNANPTTFTTNTSVPQPQSAYAHPSTNEGDFQRQQGGAAMPDYEWSSTNFNTPPAPSSGYQTAPGAMYDESMHPVSPHRYYHHSQQPQQHPTNSPVHSSNAASSQQQHNTNTSVSSGFVSPGDAAPPPTTQSASTEWMSIN